MTYEIRLTQNYSFGVLTQAAAISDFTFTSADFAAGLPSGLSTTTYVPMVLQDPSLKVYEIVWVNAHTAAASTATVLRGREGTSARGWPSGTLWTVAPTLRDVQLPVANRAALPADPHVGMRALIQDEQVIVEWSLSTGWATPVKTLAGRVVTTAGVLHSLTDGTETQVAKLVVLGKPIKSGVFYDLAVGLTGNFGSADQSVTVRVRQGATFGAAAELVQWSWVNPTGGFATNSASWAKPWKATADNASTNFYVSVQRISGSAQIDILGDRRPTFVITDRSADTNAWAEVA